MSALQKASESTTALTRSRKGSVWGKWEEFCAKHRQDPSLEGLKDHETKLCYILIFASMYRTRKGPTGDPVRSDTVGKACSAVGEGISHLARFNPTKAFQGQVQRHPVLVAFLDKLSKEDSPSTRAYPINLAIIEGLEDALDVDHPILGPRERHIIDLSIIAWFWLLRPAEYCETDASETRSQAFRLCDVVLTIGSTPYQATAAPLNDPNSISRITSACLKFDDQKNAVRGEFISQKANSHPTLCGAKALGRVCRHLIRNGASPLTPLHQHYNGVHKKWYSTQSRHITNALRHSAKRLEPSTGILSNLCTARGMRPGGATALLCAGVDADRVGLLGRWKSDAMLTYLRIQACNRRASQQMLDHGRFTFAPGAYGQADALPQQASKYAALLDHTELYDED